MIMNSPSIFNDVIGPVMRGPSSSHCAAALRIGRMCRDLMNNDLTNIYITFDPNGSLATTHKSQGSDMGIFGGFMGWEAHDERLPLSETYLEAYGIFVHIDIKDIQADHPNTYQLTLSNANEIHSLTAISTGGGMIEVIAIDRHKVSMAGDYFETLIYCDNPSDLVPVILDSISPEFMECYEGISCFLEIKTQALIPDDLLEKWRQQEGVEKIKILHPVLPIKARRDMDVPFNNCQEMFAYNSDKNLELWELALKYESLRGNISEREVFDMMRKIGGIMHHSIQLGLKGTHYEDRILDSQSLQFQDKLSSHKLLGGDANNLITMYVSAVMEVKSSMGIIVAAPTAGSCGALPGAIFGMAHAMCLSEEEIVKALLSAGLIGVFIAKNATFAAEVGGCMAETGSAGGMAAAALVGLKGGSLSQAIGAASLALQNALGLICDPIGNRVEAPCLGRNVMAASNAVACANMALSNYQYLIPLDEVIETMKAVGDQIHHTLRCTNLGGLSITGAAKKIERELDALPTSFFKSC
jgi:L-serine dehydratase